MSALFGLSFDLARLSGRACAGTIIRTQFADIPDLPLTSRDVDLLRAPPAILPAPPIIRPAPRGIDEARVLALALHRDRERLHGWDRTLVRELVKWRREPSAWEVEQVAALAERVFWQSRDGATPC